MTIHTAQNRFLQTASCSTKHISAKLRLVQHKQAPATQSSTQCQHEGERKCISKHCMHNVLCLPTPAPSHQQPLKHQCHPNQARPSPVSEVLRGNVSNGQLGQHHLGTALVNLVQLVIENLPFSIHNGLVLLPHTHHHTRLTGHPIQTFLPITVSKASSSLHAGHLFLRFFSIPGDILQISDYHPYMP